MRANREVSSAAISVDYVSDWEQNPLIVYVL